MTTYNIDIKNHTNLDYEPNPSFGTVQVPVMLWAEISKDKPIGEIHITDLKDVPLNPFTATLHYGQSIFEGLKAYQLEDNIGIFRLKDAAKRFHTSAQIMSMAPIPTEIFEEAVTKYVEKCQEYIPGLDKHSLYLRPLLFAKDQKIKVASSNSYIFMVMSSIVGDYFASADIETKVLVSKNFIRAFKGGTGEAKTAANYALSLPSVNFANKHGYQQVLYLDAEKRSEIEELGGMNFFWVKNNELYTPILNGQILHGITRKTIIEIAQMMGMVVHEATMTLAELQTGHADGSITETFACGTAATIVPIDEIGVLKDDESIEPLKFSPGPVAKKLRDYLYDTHRGHTELSKKYLSLVF